MLSDHFNEQVMADYYLAWQLQSEEYKQKISSYPQCSFSHSANVVETITYHFQKSPTEILSFTLKETIGDRDCFFHAVKESGFNRETLIAKLLQSSADEEVRRIFAHEIRQFLYLGYTGSHPDRQENEACQKLLLNEVKELFATLPVVEERLRLLVEIVRNTLGENQTQGKTPKELLKLLGSDHHKDLFTKLETEYLAVLETSKAIYQYCYKENIFKKYVECYLREARGYIPFSRDFGTEIPVTTIDIINQLFGFKIQVYLLRKPSGISSFSMQADTKHLENIILQLSQKTAELEAMQEMIDKGRSNPAPELLINHNRIKEEIQQMEAEKARILGEFENGSMNKMRGYESRKPDTTELVLANPLQKGSIIPIFHNGINHFWRLDMFTTSVENSPVDDQGNSFASSTSITVSTTLIQIIENIYQNIREFEVLMRDFKDIAIQKHFHNLPKNINTSLERIKRLLSQPTLLKSTFKVEIERIQKLIESRIGFIESESSNYPEKIQVVELVGNVINGYLALSNALEPQPAIQLISNFRWRDARLRLEQQLICQEISLNALLNKLLDELKDIAEDHFLIPNKCFISYAWASDEAAHEKWIQPFLTHLREHLRIAGVNAILDIKDNPPGGNIYQYMNQVTEADCVVIVGTESLLQKHESGTTAVCNELILINQRRAQHKGKTLPILLSGTFANALPPYFLMYTTVSDWRERSYLANLKRIFAGIYGIGPDNVEYNNLWSTFEISYPLLMKGFSEEVVIQRIEEEEIQKSQQIESDGEQVRKWFERINKKPSVSSNIREKLSTTAYYKEREYISQELELYVPPFSCDPEREPIVSSSAEKLPFLKDSIANFFAAKEKVLLLKGGPGSGKTLFGCYLEKECYLKKDFLEQLSDHEKPIIIFIYLPSFQDPIYNLMKEYFTRRFDTSAIEVIEQLKTRKNLYFFLDAYDEIESFQKDVTEVTNLYESNRLYEWKEAKFIISCRTSILNIISKTGSYKKYFAPAGNSGSQYNLLKVIQMAIFNKDQINLYIDKYVELRNQDPLTPIEVRGWKAEKYQENIEKLPNIEELVRSPLLLKMTVQALPIIVAWHAARQQSDPGNLVRVTERDVYLAYLKDNLLRQESRQIQNHVKLQPNFKVELLRFLINLCCEMQKHKLSKVMYSFCPGNLDKTRINNGPGWATQFFGDPWLEQDEKRLKDLEMIRNNLTCLLVYEHDKWGFIHDSFIGKIDSLNFLELSNLKGKLTEQYKENARDESIARFATAFFLYEEGPYYYYLTGKQELETTTVDEAVPMMILQYEQRLTSTQSCDVNNIEQGISDDISETQPMQTAKGSACSIS